MDDYYLAIAFLIILVAIIPIGLFYLIYFLIRRKIQSLIVINILTLVFSEIGYIVVVFLLGAIFKMLSDEPESGIGLIFAVFGIVLLPIIMALNAIVNYFLIYRPKQKVAIQKKTDPMRIIVGVILGAIVGAPILYFIFRFLLNN